MTKIISKSMYIPQHFAVNDGEQIFAFIKANPFGQLISSVNGRLFCSHIPFLVSKDKESLIGHVAKSNPQWESIEGQEALVTLLGAHGYISSSWYSSPGVPTWNYQSVHVYGKPHLITDRDELRSIVKELTKVHEASMQEPWRREYEKSLLEAIVGIEIEISEVQCKYKLSQNRPDNDRRQVVEELQGRGSAQLSRAMKNRLP